ncbi:hypothetical protein [Sorangium sp. So ce861]|uniref:hypothetical protein n=1 Tax=Sorangium sp. So ce861 TaxID=3133323 RepID=UPI003F635AF3
MKLNRRSALLTRSVLLAALCAAPAACVENKNGDVFSATPGTFNIEFTGYHSEPNYGIEVQMLDDVEGDASHDIDNTNWVTVISTTSGNTPIPDEFGTTSYAWSATVPSFELGARWLSGGILRWRVIDAAGHPLETADQDYDECYNEQVLNGANSWTTIRDNCRSPWNQTSFISSAVSPTQLNPKPPYISRKAVGSASETVQYYTTIGAPQKLSDTNPSSLGFKQRFGFGAAGSNEVSAVYYNAGDLGVGREMHCKSFANDPVTAGTDPGVACYVSNYDVDNAAPFFAGNRSATDEQTILTRTVDGFNSGTHAGAFATVAMWYTSPISANNSVRFVVYDANGNRLNEAPLDTYEYNKSIPQNCIACHGGGNYDAANNRVLGASSTQNGARFLAFDLDAFEFSTATGFTRAAQEENFRKLNAMILAAAPSTQTQELITGWYAHGGGNVNTPGTVQNNDFTPPLWTNDPNSSAIAINGIKRPDAKIYSDVFATYCRGCHVSQSGVFAFSSASDFRSLETLIMGDICGVHEMPHAEVTLERFWKSPARSYLVSYYDYQGGCNP